MNPGMLESLLAGPVAEVAPRLLGGVITHGEVQVRITEVEAYGGPDDPGSHAYRGRTARNAAMFGPPGRLYVYFTYGMHWCANVVCRPEGEPGAVLLRAGEVIRGEAAARRRRGTAPHRNLARGPARLTRSLGIEGSFDGLDLGDGPVLLAVPGIDPAVRGRVREGPRVGLRGAPERPWRFWIEGEPTVSPYRAARSRG